MGGEFSVGKVIRRERRQMIITVHMSLENNII